MSFLSVRDVYRMLIWLGRSFCPPLVLGVGVLHPFVLRQQDSLKKKKRVLTSWLIWKVARIRGREPASKLENPNSAGELRPRGVTWCASSGVPVQGGAPITKDAIGLVRNWASEEESNFGPLRGKNRSASFKTCSVGMGAHFAE